MVCPYTAALNSHTTLQLSPYLAKSAPPAERVRAAPSFQSFAGHDAAPETGPLFILLAAPPQGLQLGQRRRPGTVC